MAEQSIANLIGCIVFAIISLIVIVISEKMLSNYSSFSDLAFKILVSIIGGLIFSTLIYFFYLKFGLSIALKSFSVILFAMGLYIGLYAKDKIKTKS